MTIRAAAAGIALGLLLYAAVLGYASLRLSVICGPPDEYSSARCYQALQQ